ncbi:MAG: GAF domain-containing protein [Limisphaerales bacterium]
MKKEPRPAPADANTPGLSESPAPTPTERKETGETVGIMDSSRDIVERKQAEHHIQQLNRVYALLSDVNQTIVREKDPQAMLQAVCRIAVEKGKFRMAWIGRYDASTEELQPVASSGVVDGYTDLLKLTLRDETCAAGPSLRCILSGEHTICNDIAHDPFFARWREEALRRGYRSSGSFPLQVDGRTVGVFNLYAASRGFSLRKSCSCSTNWRWTFPLRWKLTGARRSVGKRKRNCVGRRPSLKPKWIPRWMAFWWWTAGEGRFFRTGA